MNTRAHKLWVLLFISTLMNLCLCDLTELWSTEHFEVARVFLFVLLFTRFTSEIIDIILSDAYGTSVPALSPAIVALYETPCRDKLYRQIGFTDRNFPNGMHLQFVTFDRLHAKTKVWYEWDSAVMDLFEYYNISIESSKDSDDWCPTILYQPANFSLPVRKYNAQRDGSFNDWVWKMIRIEAVEFINTLDETVLIMFRYMDPGNADIVNEQIIASIPPKATATIDNLHAGDILVAATESGELSGHVYFLPCLLFSVLFRFYTQITFFYLKLHFFLQTNLCGNRTVNRYVLDTITNTIEITKSTDLNVIDDMKFLNKYNNDLDLLRRRNWSTRRRFLNNIKAPPLMPTFTERGFQHTKAPKEICDYMTQFYEENKNKKRLESFPKDGTQINAREIPTYMMHLPGDKKRWIAGIMEKMLSEWSGVELVYSTMYGLREYVHGAVLKPHVDRIETHIVSAIIHVTHEPHNVSWPLEVVSWDGQRYNLVDTDCDMVFYESSKLIHGRPEPYEGNSWINAFLHFRPKSWDGYTFTPQNIVKTPNAEVPLVDFVYG